MIFSVVISCTDENNSAADQKTMAELKKYKSMDAKEQETEQFIKDYIRAVNSADWRSKLPKYLEPNPEEFLKEHSVFRTSFPNYKATIKHLAVDGNEGVVWINVTANFAKAFDLEDDSDYGDNILKGIAAKDQPLSWDETWYFNVVDGKFGDKFDFLKDNYKVLKDLRAIESK